MSPVPITFCSGQRYSASSVGKARCAPYWLSRRYQFGREYSLALASNRIVKLDSERVRKLPGARAAASWTRSRPLPLARRSDAAALPPSPILCCFATASLPASIAHAIRERRGVLLRHPRVRGPTRAPELAAPLRQGHQASPDEHRFRFHARSPSQGELNDYRFRLPHPVAGSRGAQSRGAAHHRGKV
jgi:hypothetical protein